MTIASNRGFASGAVLDGDTAGGDLSGTYPDPVVDVARGIRETAGPTELVAGAIADGAFLKRSGSTLVGGSAGADWTITTRRYYAVDSAAGNDGNAGYSDVSGTAAGTVAWKTLAKALSAIPATGAGRMATLLLKTATFVEPLIIPFTGYGDFVVRSTSDFSDNANDKARCSYGNAAAGDGAGGEWTCAAGGSATVFTVSDTATFTAEPALLGCRVRFLTGALAGEVQVVHANTTNQITLLDPLANPPSAGDTFVVEQPGVVVSNVVVTGVNGRAVNTAIGAQYGGTSIVGIRTGGYIYVGGVGRLTMSFVQATGVLHAQSCGRVLLDKTWGDATGGTNIATGGGFVAASVTATDCGAVEGRVYSTGATGPSYTSCGLVRINGYAGGQTVAMDCGDGGAASAGAIGFGNAGSAGQGRMRAVGGVYFNRSSGTAYGVNATSASTGNAIQFGGIGLAIQCDDVIGSSGNTTYGIGPSTAYAARGCTVTVGVNAACTVSGTSGEIIAGDGAVIIDHADLTKTNVIDDHANHWIGSAGVVARCFYRMTEAGSGSIAIGAILRAGPWAARTVTTADADSINNSTGVIGCAATSPATSGQLYVVTSGPAYANVVTAVDEGSLVYTYSAPTGRLASSPAANNGTNAKLRVGRSLAKTAQIVMLDIELVPVLSDGATP